MNDGKGLRAVVRKAFRHRTLFQRCQWHERENVVSYLAKSERVSCASVSDPPQTVQSTTRPARR